MAAANRWGIIWDVDGTMVATAELHFAAWVELARQLGKPFRREQFTATFGQRNPEILRAVFGPDYADPEIEALGRRKEAFYRAAAQKGVALLPGVRALLEELHAAEFRQAIGSSAPRENLDLILRLTQTERFFDALVSQEDTQRGKPDPQVFLVAAARLGVPPAQCLVMEDAPSGVQAARAGGMKCIAVDATGSHTPASLREAGANLVVPTLENVSVETVRQILQQ